MEGKDARSERERMVAGEAYRPDDAELARERERADALLRRLNALPGTDSAARADVLRQLFGRVGKDPAAVSPFHCDYGFNVTAGDRFFANSGCVILDVCPVRIGDDVMLGPQVVLAAATHPLDAAARRSGLECGAPISIGDDVWIGAGAVVNPGVSIGAGTVIGSGSVVTRDIPAGVVAAGNPCRVLRAIGEEERAAGERFMRSHGE